MKTAFILSLLTIAAMYYLRSHGREMHWVWVWAPAIAWFVAIVASLLVVFSVGHDKLLGQPAFDAAMALMMATVPITFLVVWVKLVRVLL